MAIEQEYQSALRANEMRYAQAMSIYDEIIKRYQPGGTFGKAALGQLEKQKVRTVGAETQQMISSGLYGTTTTAGLPGKWEAEVGAPSRLRLEDIMMERLSQAQIGKAGFIERREDVYPDVGRYAQYAQQTAQAAPSGRRSYGASSFPDMFSMPGLQPGGAPRTGGTGGAVYGMGTQEATMAERERRAQAAATVGTKTYGEAQTAVQPTSEQAAGVPTSLATGAQMSRTLGQPKPGLEPGQAYGAYGKATFGPTTAKESIAYSKWKKRTGGSKETWAMQYRA